MDTAAELYAKEERKLYIETCTGRRFYIDAPEFELSEIAHALSMQCRYTGHVRTFYSVAEHCVLVSRLMYELDLGDPFEGLMHDAAEAYLTDIASPWKVLLPDYKVLEQRIEVPLRALYKLPNPMTEGCKRADWLALFIEAHHLLPSKAKDWTSPPGVKEQADYLIAMGWRPIGWDPALARTMFLERYSLLTSNV